MLIRKGFRFRVYPSPEQTARLRAWEDSLRFLWNLANEQRLMGLARPKGEKRYPTAFDQMRELTELRAELPWLADVPRNVCAHLLVELDLAWQRCFKRLGRTPRWKRKNSDVLGLCESHFRGWRLDGSMLRFPKLGPVRLVLHRPLEGKPKTCTVRRDGDQWFASVLCEIEIADPLPRVEPVVALDRGVVNLVADSDGRVVPNPQHLKRAMVRLAHAQRVVARRKKGSKNREKAKIRVARLHRTVRRQRDHLLHVVSHGYAKSHGTVVVERLQIQNMAASARGSVDAPGHNVRQKAGLNRSILDAGWGKLTGMLRYKLAWSGGRLVEASAAYSSQTCGACGHVDGQSRRTQARFECVSCGHRAHADLNAAQVLLQRFRAVEPTVTGCGGSAIGRPARQQLRVVRRATRHEGSGSKASAFRPR